MSFRNRLTSFFIVIVLAPMLAVGALAFVLIDNSVAAKAQSRANGVFSTAATRYAQDEEAALPYAKAVAARVPSIPMSGLQARLVKVASRTGLQRIVVTRDGSTLADVGSPTAIAPAIAEAISRGTVTTVSVSRLTAAQFVSTLAGPTTPMIVREGATTLGSSKPLPGGLTLPADGHYATVTVDGKRYGAYTGLLGRLGSGTITLTALSSYDATGASVTQSRLVAAALILAVLLLALSFALLASRSLSGQLSRFLRAARRLAGGDFSAPVPVQGRDEFAMLAVEFNNMSQELAERLRELEAERQRLRESIRRAGQTFASNLDRSGLLRLSLGTAMDAVEASFGRLTARDAPDEPLREIAREWDVDSHGEVVLDAERQALREGGLTEIVRDDVVVVSVPLAHGSDATRAHGLITVGRERPFSDDDKDVLRSLIGQAALALENVELHEEVQRQAVTDELTGLANHGRFQEVLGDEMDQVRRYHYAVGLIMIDLDDFKAINDTYGHPQGDLVLKAVSRVLKENSRDADAPARYGGEELALILPHTDLEGAFAIAERIRAAVEDLEIPLLDGTGVLRVTASLGVCSSSEGSKQSLVADTDAALYRAKRDGKNRVVRALAATVDVLSSE